MTSTPAAPPTSDYHPSRLARAIATMSGRNGRVAKWILLSLVNALVIWSIGQLFAQGKPLWALITTAVLGVLDLIYLLPGLVPAKFIAPGTVFLVAYLLIPIFFTVTTAFQVYSTGHVLTQDEAIKSIQLQSLQPTGVTYVMAPARDANGDLVLLLVDDETGKQAVGTPEGLT